MIFPIIGFIFTILIYTRINVEPWYASLLIKKGEFSCLIALFTYSICYTILQVGIIEDIKNFEFEDLINLILNYIFGKNKKVRVIDFIKN